ncbi:MAG: hypothetical protein ABIH63_02185 [archaeon]
MKALEIDLKEVYSKHGVLNREEMDQYKKQGIEKLMKEIQLSPPTAQKYIWEGKEVVELQNRLEMLRAMYDKGARKITVEEIGSGGALQNKPIKLKDARLLTQREYDQWFAYLTI